jgi:hypothetical protein
LVAREKPERDYNAELQRGLELIFGDFLISYQFESRATSDPVYMLGYSSAASYLLHIIVLISELDMMRLKDLGKIRSSVDFESIVRIGDYTPIQFDQRFDSTGRQVWMLHYITSDLDHFLDEVHKKSWCGYNDKMNELIDDILSD